VNSRGQTTSRRAKSNAARKQIEEKRGRAYMSQLDTADRRTAAGEDPSEAGDADQDTALRKSWRSSKEEVKTAGRD